VFGLYVIVYNIMIADRTDWCCWHTV